jgi:hypothetical protein
VAALSGSSPRSAIGGFGIEFATQHFLGQVLEMRRTTLRRPSGRIIGVRDG